MVGPILAIVGSQELTIEQAENARWLCQCAVGFLQPRAFVSGGAVGVDTLAENVVIANKIPYCVIRPEVRQWEDRDGKMGFRSRNIKIAQACEVLVSIRSKTSKSYGSGWTADYAEELGKEVKRIYV